MPSTLSLGIRPFLDHNAIGNIQACLPRSASQPNAITLPDQGVSFLKRRNLKCIFVLMVAPAKPRVAKTKKNVSILVGVSAFDGTSLHATPDFVILPDRSNGHASMFRVCQAAALFDPIDTCF